MLLSEGPGKELASEVIQVDAKFRFFAVLGLISLFPGCSLWATLTF